jgi:glycosyltransferase involved in cell wall biosynthesis
MEQHKTIHNGMPEAAPAFMANPAKSPVRLGMIARFEQPKDHETLIHALSQCMELPWTLEFIGPGPQQQDIEGLVARLGMTDRVSFLGFRADIPEVLAEQQIFVLISRWEGFPRSILEAMRAGLPVVASNVGGVKEAVAHEINGYVVEPGDLNGLASCLRRLITDPRLRARMGAEGRKRYEDSFTFDRMLEQTLEQYQESLGRTGTPPS